MNRRALLISLSLFALAAATVACNFPGIGQQPQVTQTAAAVLALTAAQDATFIAGKTALALTQTGKGSTGPGTAVATQAATADSATQPAPTGSTQQPATTATVATQSADLVEIGISTAAATAASGATATQTSVAQGTLKVGVEALVRTAASALNLRDSAGTKGKILAKLPGDTRVKITDGPIAADGSLWWQVTVLTSGASDAVGKTGWCAESTGGLQTLELAR